MQSLSPTVRSTDTSPDLREWLPKTFDNLLREIDHLCGTGKGSGQVPLFRGHVDSEWLLDSKLVRTMLVSAYGSNPPYPRPITFHTKVIDVLLAKFEHQCRPSAEALAKEATHGIDPEYELMKHFQQYADNDFAPYGTFLMDWTIERDIALYFSTYDGRGETRRLRSSEGAIWVFYPMETGNVLMTRKLREILTLMKADDFRFRANKTVPLIFHPHHQTAMPRAMAQKPVYVAQMDFCSDLADIWSGMENEECSCIFKKIILSESVLPDIVKHLEKNGIDETRVYPD